MRLFFCLIMVILLAPPAWAGRRDEAIRASLAAARRASGARRASLQRAYYLYKLRTGQLGSDATDKKTRKATTRIVEKRGTRKARQVRPVKVLKRKASGTSKRKQMHRNKKQRTRQRSVLGAVAAGLQVDDPAALPASAEPGAGNKTMQDKDEPKTSRVRRKKPEPKTDNPDQLKRMPIERQRDQ